MLEFDFKDYNDEYADLLTKKRKMLGLKKPGLFSVDEANAAIGQLYARLGQSSDASTKLTIHARHRNSEQKVETEADYEVEIFANDGRSNNLGTVLDDAIALKPSGADDYDQLILGIVHGALGQEKSFAVADQDAFPEGGDHEDQPSDQSTLYDQSGTPIKSVDHQDSDEMGFDDQSHSTAESDDGGFTDDDLNGSSSPDSSFDDESSNEYENADPMPSDVFGGQSDDHIFDESPQKIGEQEPNVVTSEPSRSQLIDFAEYTSIDLQIPKVKLDRDSVLQALGIDPNAGDELSRRKAAKVIALYHDMDIDAKEKELSENEQQNRLDAIAKLREAYNSVNEVEVTTAAEERASDRIAEVTPDLVADANEDIQGYEKDAANRQAAVDKSTSEKIAALTADANATASREKDQIASEAVTRREERNQRLQETIAQQKSTLLKEFTKTEINQRNSDLVAQRNQISQDYMESQSAIIRTGNTLLSELHGKALGEFDGIEEAYHAERERQADRTAKENLAKANAQLAEANRKNNKLQEDFNRISKENSQQFAQAAQTNATQAMMAPMAAGQSYQQIQDLQRKLEKAQEQNEELRDALSSKTASSTKVPKSSSTLVVSLIGAAAFLLVVGGGVFGYHTIEVNQANANARVAAQIKAANQTSTKSLNDLVSEGQYEEAAKNYTSVAAIAKITDAIFTSGTPTQLKEFVDQHPSIYGNLDVAILGQDPTEIMTQYNALSAQDKARLSSSQQKAVDSAQATQSSKESDTNAKNKK